MVMSFVPKPSDQRTATTPRGFAELSVVALTHAVMAEEGSVLAGTRGIVVAAYSDGKGYEVEFERPFHAVATLEAGDLTA